MTRHRISRDVAFLLAAALSMPSPALALKSQEAAEGAGVEELAAGLLAGQAGAEEGRSVLYPPRGKKAEMLFREGDPSGIAQYITQVAPLAQQITVTIAPWTFIDRKGQQMLQRVARAQGIPLTIVQLEFSRQSVTYTQFVYELDARMKQPVQQRRESPLTWVHPVIQVPFIGHVLASGLVEVGRVQDEEANDRLAAKAMLSVTHLTALDPIPVVQLAAYHPHLISFLAEAIEEYGAIGNPGALEPLRVLQGVLEESEPLAARQSVGASEALARIRHLQQVVSTSIAQLSAPTAGLEQMATTYATVEEAVRARPEIAGVVPDWAWNEGAQVIVTKPMTVWLSAQAFTIWPARLNAVEGLKDLPFEQLPEDLGTVTPRIGDVIVIDREPSLDSKLHDWVSKTLGDGKAVVIDAGAYDTGWDLINAIAQEIALGAGPARNVRWLSSTRELVLFFAA